MLCTSIFFFNDTATTEIYTLSLHDALPIWRQVNDLDLRAVLGQPVPGQPRPVRLQPVQDEEHLAAGLPDQALEEAEEGRGVDRAVHDHPAQLALVGHR